MRHPIATLCLSLAIMVTAGCGFHLRGTSNMPDQLHAMKLESSDPYGPLTRAVRSQLKQSGVEIASDDEEAILPALRIIGSSQKQDTVSIFQDGKTAEYQMVMEVNAQVILPEKGVYPISVRVFRSFFDNPLTALAKDAEQEMLRQEMREQAAQQLIRKMLTIQNVSTVSPETDTDVDTNTATQ